jgi:hypothetical protein
MILYCLLWFVAALPFAGVLLAINAIVRRRQ